MLTIAAKEVRPDSTFSPSTPECLAIAKAVLASEEVIQMASMRMKFLSVLLISVPQSPR